jgi:hypothetical protein
MGIGMSLYMWRASAVDILHAGSLETWSAILALTLGAIGAVVTGVKWLVGLIRDFDRVRRAVEWVEECQEDQECNTRHRPHSHQSDTHSDG